MCFYVIFKNIVSINAWSFSFKLFQFCYNLSINQSKENKFNMKITNKLIGDFLGMTPQGAGKWKTEGRDIILFIEKYLKKDEIEEFLKTKKIQKFETVNNLTANEIKVLLSKKVDINDIAPKLYKFHRRSLSYFYFLVNNNKINDLNEFRSYIKQDVDNAKERSWIKFIKSMKWDSGNDYISFNAYASEFRDVYEDNINDTEIEFILNNEESRNSFKRIIQFIVDNKLFKI